MYQISYYSDAVNSPYFKEGEENLPKHILAKVEKIKKTASERIALLLIEHIDDERHFQIYSEIDPNDGGKVIESMWTTDIANITEKVQRDFKQPNRFTTVLVNGGNGTGKSLFVKAMGNSLLTMISMKGSKASPKHYSVVVFDIDVGQALYGMPCGIKAYEVLKPILSNYEIKVSYEEKENSVLKYIKSYFINVISPEAQEEYYLAMINHLFEDLKFLYLGKNVAVVINTFGWNTSVGNLIHEEIAKIVRPDHKVELRGVDFKDTLLLEDNTSQKAIEVLSKCYHLTDFRVLNAFKRKEAQE